MEIPTFKSKESLIDFLVENKSTIIAEKKMELQKSDAISYVASRIDEKGDVIKATANSSALLESTALNVELVINTTNLMDSHRDVHFKGIWSKSLKETKGIYLLQEHVMSFKTIISDSVKASARTMEWSELGFKYAGSTQALIFKATIEKERNPFMFEQYAKGYVKNHSVGMRYVKVALASNDERYPEEVAIWNKYFDSIANKEEVEQIGYFWAVTEAKIIEGSAVVMGSNVATPTLSVESKDIESPGGTQDDEPSKDTQKVKVTSKGSAYFY